MKYLVSVLLVVSLACGQDVSTTSSQAYSIITTSPTTHALYAPIVLTGPKFTPTLHIQNMRIDVPISVRPSVLLHNREIQLPSVVIAAHTVASVDMSKSLPTRDGKDTVAGVILRYDFVAPGAIAAFVRNTNISDHLFINSHAKAVEPSSEAEVPHRLDAVLWSPGTRESGYEGFISVLNTSSKPRTVIPTLFVGGRSRQLPEIEVGPTASHIIPINHLLDASRPSGIGFRLSFSGHRGDIIADGMLMNSTNGFAKSIKFGEVGGDNDDPLRTTLFFLGQQPAAAGFPAGISFESVLVMRNTGPSPVSVTPVARFLRGTNAETATLQSVTLDSGESAVLNLNAMQEREFLPRDFHQGTLELLQSGTNASLVAELFTYSRAEGYELGSAFVTYPGFGNSAIWRTDGSFQTEISVENTAATGDTVNLSFYSADPSFNNGKPFVRAIPIAASGLISVNAKQLLDGMRDEGFDTAALGSGGVLSVLGSNGSHSKLLIQRLVYSADQADYVGFPSGDPGDPGGGGGCIFELSIVTDVQGSGPSFTAVEIDTWSSGLVQTVPATIDSNSNPGLVSVSGSTLTVDPSSSSFTSGATADLGFSLHSCLPDCTGILVSSSISIRIADSNYIFNGMKGSSCQYNLFCPNGNTTATCNIEPIFAAGPPTNTCQNYLHNHNLVVNKKCFFVGKAEMSNLAMNCN